MKPRRLSWFSRPPRWARFVLYAVAIGFIVWAWLPNWSDLSSTEAPLIIKKAGEPDSYNVTVGDVVVNLVNPPFRVDRQTKFVEVHVNEDPRFKFSRSFTGLYVFIQVLSNGLTSSYDEMVGNSLPEPDLYPAPPSMSVFKHVRNNGLAVIRMNGSTFLGRTPYFFCSREPMPLPGSEPARRCDIESPLTEKTSVRVTFYDNRYPAAEWPALLESLENGIRQITSRGN